MRWGKAQARWGPGGKYLRTHTWSERSNCTECASVVNRRVGHSRREMAVAAVRGVNASIEQGEEAT